MMIMPLLLLPLLLSPPLLIPEYVWYIFAREESVPSNWLCCCCCCYLRGTHEHPFERDGWVPLSWCLLAPCRRTVKSATYHKT